MSTTGSRTGLRGSNNPHDVGCVELDDDVGAIADAVGAMVCSVLSFFRLFLPLPPVTRETAFFGASSRFREAIRLFVKPI